MRNLAVIISNDAARNPGQHKPTLVKNVEEFHGRIFHTIIWLRIPNGDEHAEAQVRLANSPDPTELYALELNQPSERERVARLAIAEASPECLRALIAAATACLLAGEAAP